MSDDRIHDNEVEVVSIRLKKSVKDEFRRQAKKEKLTQSRMLEKMIRLYTGRGVEEESVVPFNVHLFWFAGGMGKKNIIKRVYKGIGIPLYFSEVFRFYGKSFQSDSSPLVQLDFRNNFMDYRHYFCSELQFNPNFLVNSEWREFDHNQAEEFKKDFNIDSVSNYHYMSAFRVFKESASNGKSFLLVNEQAYLINTQIYENLKAEWYKNEINMRSGTLGCISAEDLDFAISSLYKIDLVENGEKILRLDRKYLDTTDVTNLTNILNPVTFKDDIHLDEVISLYAIGK